ncbi:MAG: hypothetical protein ACTSU4_03820 [Promethearchaeota archaeon]
MSEELKQIINSSYDNGVPIWIYTQDYIYGLVPADPEGNRWTEYVYTFQEPDEPLEKKERNAGLSYQFLFEEVEKGVSFYVKDLNVLKLKEFVKTIENKPDPEKLKALINELITNAGSYSANLPIIKSKEELSILIEKL